ncbi:MAG: glycine zipper domain-containing protein [Gemmatimonadaceae bacterium]
MDNDRNINDSTDGRIERAKDNALGKHDSNPSVADEIGEGVGGIGGALAGAAVGSLAGPVGTLIGGIAGAMGGWWTGRAISEATSTLTHDDDNYYRSHYEGSPSRLADRGFEDVRPAYHLGHVAAHNPDYANKSFSDVEGDLQRGWNSEPTKKFGDWKSVSGYASEGFYRGRSTAGSMAAGAAATAGGAMNKMGNAAENTMDRAASGAEHVGNKAANVVDDLKDRVDGNPASRPGPDSTDSARRQNS